MLYRTGDPCYDATAFLERLGLHPWQVLHSLLGVKSCIRPGFDVCMFLYRLMFYECNHMHCMVDCISCIIFNLTSFYLLTSRVTPYNHVQMCACTYPLKFFELLCRHPNNFKMNIIV